MCGIAALVGPRWERGALEAMVAVQRHRGPDDEGVWRDAQAGVALGHDRLAILDLSSAGHQPMPCRDGESWIAFNGEIYNYLELRSELGGEWRSDGDTEVLLEAWRRWGPDCLPRLIGMFAFALWDARRGELFAARDRFGVKPLYLHRRPDGGALASEIKALHAAGVPREPDPVAWATYLASGMYDHGTRTFWRGVERVPPGGFVRWDAARGWRTGLWYDLAATVSAAGPDLRGDDAVADEALALLEESVRLRFRSDVPVGICLSGGLDSSLLLGLVHRLQGEGSEVAAFTFECGDPAYDETPWVRMMLERTRHPWHACRLDAADVPQLAQRAQWHQDEPFGGLPTLGMGRVHERAREQGVTVLLDGNGLDEAFAGYDYYQTAARVEASRGPVQGSRSPSTRAECLRADFAALAEPFDAPRPFGEPLRDLQLRDLCFAKIPRAMRFADRISMMCSREVREPFLDHRIVELGLRQPPERKIRDGQGKWLLRRIARALLPQGVVEAPKRALQTPQREWLRGPLAEWVDAHIEAALAGWGREWLDARGVRAEWQRYRREGADNSFPVWQWLSLGLCQRSEAPLAAAAPARGLARR